MHKWSLWGMVARVRGEYLSDSELSMLREEYYLRSEGEVVHSEHTLKGKYKACMIALGADKDFKLIRHRKGGYFMNLAGDLAKGQHRTAIEFEKGGTLDYWSINGPGFHRCLWKNEEELMEKMLSSLTELGYT